MINPEKYVGLRNERNGGMTAIGKVIRDAWVFELLDEAEDCEGWPFSRINALFEQVNVEWDKYGCLVSQLPTELFERHQRIHGEAIGNAKKAGWSGENETDNEE